MTEDRRPVLRLWAVAALAAAASALILVQTLSGRTAPFSRPRYSAVWDKGEQLLPVTAPRLPTPRLPEAASDRLGVLERRCVHWSLEPAEPRPEHATAGSARGELLLFLRVSPTHWACTDVDGETLAVLTAEEDAALSMSPGSRLMLFVSLADFADDDDGDGDWLDAGELRLEGPGAQVELFRR